MLPQQIVAGDTLDFETSVPDYPPADGWTLKHILVPRFSTPAQSPVTLTASTSGTVYRTQVPPVTTAAWVAGAYSLSKLVEKTGARVTLSPEYAELEILPDPAALTQGSDTRTQAAKAVADLKAALATYTATNGHVAEYEIAGRRMVFRKSTEIVELLSFWQIELAREEAAAAMSAGLGNRRRIYLRASNA